MNDEAERLKKRADAAWTRKAEWIPLIRQCFEFGNVARNPFIRGESSGSAAGDERHQAKLYDSTAAYALRRGANRIQQDMFTPGKAWGRLVPGEGIPSRLRPQAGRLLSAIGKTGFAALRGSNFDTVCNVFLQELRCAGTACLLPRFHADRGTFSFAVVPVNQYALDDDELGEVSGLFRRFNPVARSVGELWPRVGQHPYVKKIVADTPDKRIRFEEMTIRDGAFWRYVVMLCEGEQKSDQNVIVLDERRRRRRFIVARWRVVPGEAQGWSDMMSALPDVRTLNRIMELLLRNASLRMGGVWLTHSQGLLNPDTVRIFPGAQVPVRYMNAGGARPMERLDVGGDLGLTQFTITELRDSIRKILSDTGLPPVQDGIRTATEIMERQRDVILDFGAPVGRLISEFAIPLLETVIGELAEAGVISGVSDNLLRIDDTVVRLEVESELARSGSLGELDALLKSVEIMDRVAGPEVRQAFIRTKKLAGWLRGPLPLPEELIADEEEAAQTMQQGAALAQQAGVIPGGPQPGAAPGAPPAQMMN